MNHRPTNLRTSVSRSVSTLAAAASLALVTALGAGCLVGDLGDDGEGSISALPDIDCTGIDEWVRNTSYPSGTKVTDTGDAFVSRTTHTAFGIDWNPKRAASLWLGIGHCVDGAGGGAGGGDDDDNGGGGGQEDPPPPEEDEEEPEQPPPAEGCLDNGRPGPLFDIAGVNNVGNGDGDQFIGGQCLDASDCASGCCALPCGICSGPGAQFQNGKQGCGFDAD